MNEVLSESNFILYAARHYSNPSCLDVDEFLNDINRFKYIKKLMVKYKESNSLKERLILNHIILLYNVFDASACTRMLALKLYNHLDVLKPFLLMLNFWPERIDGIMIENQIINKKEDEIGIDLHVAETLRKI